MKFVFQKSMLEGKQSDKKKKVLAQNKVTL